METQKIKEILEQPKKFVNTSGKEGKMADLKWADLEGAYLEGVQIIDEEKEILLERLKVKIEK